MLTASAFSSFMEYSGDLGPVNERRVEQPRASLDIHTCVRMTDEPSDVDIIHTSTGISTVSRKSLASNEGDEGVSKRRCKARGSKRGSRSQGEQGNENGSLSQRLGRWMCRGKATDSDDDSSLLSNTPKHSDIFL